MAYPPERTVASFGAVAKGVTPTQEGWAPLPGKGLHVEEMQKIHFFKLIWV